MKLLVLSDLHLEFADFRPDAATVGRADAVVLAGDIHKGCNALKWISEVFGGKPVVYVAGNHEFYAHHWSATLQALRREARQLGIHFLEDESVDLQGVRFLGCSLWTDFAYFGSDRRGEAMRDYERGLNDCFLIEAAPMSGEKAGGSTTRLTAAQVLARHEQSLAWLQTELEKNYSGKTVVVTHHLPSRLSVPAQYLDNKLTPGFASQLPEGFITQAELWIHGHTHDSCDYMLGGAGRHTWVLANPRGYPRRGPGQFENPDFRPDLLVEI